VNASGQQLSPGRVVNEVLRNPIAGRDIRESRQMNQSVLSKSGRVYCVWTGRQLSRYDIDHVIPFAVLKNNDLWSLLSAHPATNKRKRDKIPSPRLIESRKDIILHYWNLISGVHPGRFRKEVQVSLLGTSPFSDLQETALHQLESKCAYLITNRGFEEWE